MGGEGKGLCKRRGVAGLVDGHVGNEGVMSLQFVWVRFLFVFLLMNKLVGYGEAVVGLYCNIYKVKNIHR